MQTTIDQHTGNHSNGLRGSKLTEVRTDATDYISAQEYTALNAADRADFDSNLSEIHKARIELESLDADVRAAAKDGLASEENIEMDNEPQAIRRAIKDAVVTA